MGCYSVLSWFISTVTRNVACTLWKIIWCISIKLKFKLTILILNCHQFENVSSWNYVTKLKGLAINKITSSQVAGVRLSMWQGMSIMGSGCGVGVLWSHGVHAPMASHVPTFPLDVAISSWKQQHLVLLSPLQLKVLKQMLLFQVFLGILWLFSPLV